MPYIGKLGILGFAKESVQNTPVTPPTVFLPFLPPESFTPAIALLESKGVYTHADMVQRTAQGAGEIKGAKVKWELNPDTLGHALMAAFGADVVAELATFTVVAGTNDKIDFTEDGGSEVTATLTAGTYPMGLTSATAGTLCALIKAQMEAVNGAATYTVTYSYSTKKVTITKNSGVFVLKWATGTNNTKTPRALLGFTAADTSSAIAATSDSVTATPVQTHTFKRADAALLPTYTFWFKKADKYPYFSGCMLSKLILEAKAKEYITLDAEFVGQKYQGYDAGGGSVTQSYSTKVPFTFKNIQVKMDDGAVLDYDNLRLELDNSVEAEHTLNGEIWAQKVFAGGFRATLSMDLIFEDDTQYAKFIAGTEAKVELILTHPDLIGTSTQYYKMGVTIPKLNYTTAPFQLNDGLVRIPFAGVAKFNDSDSASVIATLNTEVTAAY